MLTEAKNLCKSMINEGDQVLDLPYLEETDLEGHDWLNKEFIRLPFQLYRCWLILSIVIALVIEWLFVRDMIALSSLYNTSWSSQVKEIMISQSIINLNNILLLFGCVQMLFAITKKMAVNAQKALLKLQIALIGSVGFLVIQIILKGFGFHLSLIGTLKVFILPIIVAINLVGSCFVLRAFQKNHPLTRQDIRENGGETSEDFLQQNEVIAAEILKYDQQFDRWPYLVYRFWLVLCFMLNLFLCWVACTMLVKNWQADGEDLEILVFGFYFGFGNVVGSYQMFVVIRRKLLKRSRRVIYLLKMFILVTAIIIIIWAFLKEKSLDSLRYLVCCIWIPLVSLLGAFGVRNILAQREKFVEISNYIGGEFYL